MMNPKHKPAVCRALAAVLHSHALEKPPGLPDSRFQNPKKKEHRTLERGTEGVRLTAAMPRTCRRHSTGSMAGCFERLPPRSKRFDRPRMMLRDAVCHPQQLLLRLPRRLSWQIGLVGATPSHSEVPAETWGQVSFALSKQPMARTHSATSSARGAIQCRGRVPGSVLPCGGGFARPGRAGAHPSKQASKHAPRPPPHTHASVSRKSQKNQKKEAASRANHTILLAGGAGGRAGRQAGAARLHA